MNAPVPAVIDRTRFLGGSDVAAIMGLSPWKTPLQLYEEKVNGRGPEDPARAAFFARGQRWEPIAREMLLDALEDRYGARPAVLATNIRHIDSEHPFLAAEIDVELEIDGERVNAEIKTVHPFKAKEWGEEGTDEVPVHYAAQAMHGLGITRRRRCIVGALFGADNIVAYDVAADDETIAAMRERSVAFWNSHVLARRAPDPVNMEDMMRLFARINGRPVVADEEMIGLIGKLKDVRYRIASFEEAKDELEFQLADAVRKAWSITDPTVPDESVDNALITLEGQPIATWKRQSRKSIDVKTLTKEKPEVAQAYTRETWFRSIRFPKQKGA